MAGCEKCWHDAGIRQMLLGGTKVAHYHDLLKSRMDSPCTPKEQCGELHLILEWLDKPPQCRCGKVVA